MKNTTKRSMIFYATDDQRRRIKIAAINSDISVSSFILNCVMKEVAKLEAKQERK